MGTSKDNPDPKETLQSKAEDDHADDQTKAAAHEFIDGAAAYVVLTIGKDGDVHRVSSATQGHAIMLMGSLEQQKSIFLKDLLDHRDYQDDEEDS